MTATAAVLATFAYIAAVAFLALLYVASNTDTFERRGRVTAHSERSEDYMTGDITMTKSIRLEAGTLYVHLSGSVYKCLRLKPDGSAVLMNFSSGELLTVRGCRAYPDGKIEFGERLEVREVC